MSEEEMVNGLKVEELKGCTDELKDNPDAGKYIFRAKNRWIGGTHCHTTIKGFWAGGQEDTSRARGHLLEGDEPTSLLGSNYGPNATEALLHA